MSQHKAILLPLLIGSLILLGAGCNKTESPVAEAAANEQPPAAPKPNGGMMKMEAKTPEPLTDEQTSQLAAGKEAHEPTTLTFNITAGSFYFAPNEIHVKKGDKVKIVLAGVDMMHNFALDEFNIKTDIVKPGETTTVEFTADKAGSFEYYCGVGAHRQMGQKGTLVVEE